MNALSDVFGIVLSVMLEREEAFVPVICDCWSQCSLYRLPAVCGANQAAVCGRSLTLYELLYYTKLASDLCKLAAMPENDRRLKSSDTRELTV